MQASISYCALLFCWTIFHSQAIFTLSICHEYMYVCYRSDKLSTQVPLVTITCHRHTTSACCFRRIVPNLVDILSLGKHTQIDEGTGTHFVVFLKIHCFDQTYSSF